MTAWRDYASYIFNGMETSAIALTDSHKLCPVWLIHLNIQVQAKFINKKMNFQKHANGHKRPLIIIFRKFPLPSKGLMGTAIALPSKGRCHLRACTYRLHLNDLNIRSPKNTTKAKFIKYFNDKTVVFNNQIITSLLLLRTHSCKHCQTCGFRV